MCLEYSQHFSAFLDAVSMQNLNPNVKFQLNTFDFSQMNLGTMSLVPESPERATKCTRDADCDYDIVCTSYASSSLTKGLPNAQTKNTIDLYGEDHPTKHTCVTLPKNHATSKGNSVTSKSLASCIEKGPLWEENDNIVLLGSQTHEIEEQNGNIFDAINSMSVDNPLFADNGIRCTALSHEYDYSTNLLSVSKP